MLITPEILQTVNNIRRKLKQGETVSIKDGGISIVGEAKNRADRRRLDKLRQKYEVKGSGDE